MKTKYAVKISISVIINYLLLMAYHCHAQDSLWYQKPSLGLTGFADVFYVYDFNQPMGNYREPFLYNHNRHNEFNLNLGFIKLEIDHSKYRASLAIQTGTYANDNYAAEPGLLKNIFEANIGLSLNKKNNLWIDAGVLPSHIGFESAVSIDNWTLTRSLLAENSPYFLTGAKLTYNPTHKWEIAGLIVNGWQRIQRLEGNSFPSFGTQAKFTPTKEIILNWSTFIGTDDPDVVRRMRYFNNLYGQFQFTDRFGLTVGFDIGIQQKAKESSVYDTWFSPVIIGQFVINRVWKTALRAEYYQDKTGIIIPVDPYNEFRVSGISWNIDYSPVSNISCRLEGRLLKNKDKTSGTPVNSSGDSFFIGTSIAIKFLEVIKNK